MIRSLGLLVAAWLLWGGDAAAARLADCAVHLPFGKPIVMGRVALTPVCHFAYAAEHDDNALVPRWVSYLLTDRNSLGCLKRDDAFHADEELREGARAEPEDYRGSGYDKGHQAPAQDMAWDAGVMRDSFSMANMAPQVPGLNREDWEYLEDHVRAWALARGALQVMVGPILPTTGYPTIGRNRVAVPAGFWKVIVDPARGEAIAFIMPQAEIPKGDLVDYQVTVAQVERAAGLRLPIPANLRRDSPVSLWGADIHYWHARKHALCLPAQKQ